MNRLTTGWLGVYAGLFLGVGAGLVDEWIHRHGHLVVVPLWFSIPMMVIGASMLIPLIRLLWSDKDRS